MGIDNLNNEDELKGIIEGILFAVAEAVSLDTLEKAVEADKKTIKKILVDLQNEYDYSMRGFKLIKINDTYQLSSRSEHFEYIKKVLTSYYKASLSQASLETLAIVAYKQPVTRLEIEFIRGVKSTSSLDLLIDRGLVTQAGKLENVIGKPMSFKTTNEFLKLVGIDNIEKLPKFEDFLNKLNDHTDEANLTQMSMLED